MAIAYPCHIVCNLRRAWWRGGSKKSTGESEGLHFHDVVLVPGCGLKSQFRRLCKKTKPMGLGGRHWPDKAVLGRGSASSRPIERQRQHVHFYPRERGLLNCPKAVCLNARNTRGGLLRCPDSVPGLRLGKRGILGLFVDIFGAPLGKMVHAQSLGLFRGQMWGVGGGRCAVLSSTPVSSGVLHSLLLLLLSVIHSAS